MAEEFNQKISQLLDDELNKDDALKLLSKMKNDADLQRKFKSYSMINAVLKSEDFIDIKLDFAQQISRSIEKEPAYLLPIRKEETKRHSAKISTYLVFPALAACVALFVVALNKNYHTHPVSANSALLVAESESTRQGELQKVPPSINYNQNLASNYPSRSRMTLYLQAHNSSRYIDGSVNVQPYAQVASYR